jgi:histidinol-phosphate aminotransferase
MNQIDIQNLVRENVKKLKPYSSARDEFKGSAEVFIDANENPYDNGYNRYPDPRQLKLKAKISHWRKVPMENIFIGNGSDEVIDLVIRAFCNPGVDNVVGFNPSYGMYDVSAGINDVELIKVDLKPDFTLDFQALYDAITSHTKVVFLCSPNNPSGNEIPYKDVIQFIANVNALVVVDEAYIDFAYQESLINKINDLPNLLVMQTLSKAMGSAALRIGMGFAQKSVIDVLNKIKPPYNISEASQVEALKVFDRLDEINNQTTKIKSERSRLRMEFTRYKQVKDIFPSAANFILIRVDDANKLYNYLTSEGIIVRNRHGQKHCDNCIRVTVGTPDENDLLIYKLDEYYHAENIVSR